MPTNGPGSRPPDPTYGHLTPILRWGITSGMDIKHDVIAALGEIIPGSAGDFEI